MPSNPVHNRLKTLYYLALTADGTAPRLGCVIGFVFAVRRPRRRDWKAGPKKVADGLLDPVQGGVRAR